MAIVYYSGPAVQVEAGEILNGHRVIAVINELAYHADKNENNHRHKIRGVTLGAVALSATALVQISGPLEFNGWAWTPDLPIWLGNSGALTQVIPTTGNLIQVGVADTPTRIYISIFQPIEVLA